MTSIRRIGSTQNLPSPHARGSQEAVASSGATNATQAQPPHTNAGLGSTSASFRPVASFLAQYVDQHFPWPRAPHRKDRQRQRATSAYITADMLPDLLAETLRMRPIDQKL
ncbi:MAG: hypothetical protein WA943_13765 [Parvibaculum sp.]|uniref:hypothetical protein n=1 Tax=Parvibaculum sp. TaxID=2024848 RepID=UPI003C743CC6